MLDVTPNDVKFKKQHQEFGSKQDNDHERMQFYAKCACHGENPSLMSTPGTQL